MARRRYVGPQAVLRVTNAAVAHSAHEHEAEHLHAREERAGGDGPVGDVGDQDEVRVDETGEEPVAGDVDSDGARRVLADATLRPGDQREQRRRAAAQREDRMPGQPPGTGADDLGVAPADVPENPDRHAGGERVPEQALTSGPMPAAPVDREDHERGRAHDRRIAEQRQRKTIPVQRRAGQQVQNQIADPERQLAQDMCWKAVTVARFGRTPKCRAPTQTTPLLYPSVISVRSLRCDTDRRTTCRERTRPPTFAR